MNEEFKSREFNKDGQIESKNFREFNKFDEFGKEGHEFFLSNELYEERAKIQRANASKKKTVRRRINTNLFSLIFSAVIAVTVLVAAVVESNYIDVESYVAEPYSLSFTFNINSSQLNNNPDGEPHDWESEHHRREEEFMYIAKLSEDDSREDDDMYETIFYWQPTVFFEGLSPETVYTLTVFRSDTSEVLLEQTYKTLKGDEGLPIDEPEIVYHVDSEREEIGDGWMYISFTDEDNILSSCHATVNGEEVEIMEQDGEFYISLDDLNEESTYLVEITDPNGEKTIFSKEYTTAESEVIATQLSKSVGSTTLGMEFEIEDKFGHGIEFLLNGEEFKVDFEGSTAAFSLDSLLENTEYTITLNDSKNGKELFSETVTTNFASVSVTLDNSETTYDSVSLSFAIDNPTAHPLKLIFGDSEKEISETDNEVFFDGLAEGETVNVTITDTLTNETVYSGEFTTLSAGALTITEQSSSTDYFSLSISFETDNPASHGIKVLCNSEEVEYSSYSENNVTVIVNNLNEQTDYEIEVIDTYLNESVFKKTYRTQSTPSATAYTYNKKTDCYSFSLNISADNPYNHELALAIDGVERAYTTSVSVNNLALRSRHTITVTDKNTNEVILNESLTTKSSLSVKVINAGYATCTLEKAFTDKYGTDLEVQMIPVNNYPTDGLFFWGYDNQTTLESQYSPCYNGKYTVNVIKYNNDQSTEQVDTFETEITDGVDYMTFTTSKVDGNNIRFTRKTGKFPTIGSDEDLCVVAYYDNNYNYFFLSEGDFTISNNSFTINIRSFERYLPIEYSIEYYPKLGDNMEQMTITIAEGYIE